MRDKLIKDFFVRMFSSMGMDVGTRTSKDELSDLIRSLHPVDTGKELLRVGPSGDGGYLVPDDLEGIEYCFSPGVSSESGFEAALAEILQLNFTTILFLIKSLSVHFLTRPL
jgi:hypothetical protein